MRPVPIGLSGARSVVPSPGDTASAAGNAGVEAIATVAMILWVEETCGSLLAPYVAEGEASVGVRVAVDHAGPAFAGRPVEVRAEVSAARGRKVTFSVRLEQGGRAVMMGEHVRAVVDLARFLNRRAETRARIRKPPITFFFDVHSPWARLASTLIGPLARRHDAAVIWRPLHLANLIDEIGGMRPLEQTPARVAWYEQDVADRMARHGLVHDPHPEYPLRPSRALRACVYAAERGCAEAFVRTLMRGYWAERKDISDLAVLQAMADEAGLGPRPVSAIVGDDACRRAVADNTADAIARGVFGVPSFIFDDKLYFGVDHLDLLDHALGTWTPR